MEELTGSTGLTGSSILFLIGNNMTIPVKLVKPVISKGINNHNK